MIIFKIYVPERGLITKVFKDLDTAVEKSIASYGPDLKEGEAILIWSTVGQKIQFVRKDGAEWHPLHPGWRFSQLLKKDVENATQLIKAGRIPEEL